MNPPTPGKNRLRQWVEKRWPISAVLRWSATEEIPGGSKFAYVLGSATLFLFVVLVITGVWQLLYYVPTVDHAYNSVMYLRTQVPLGWLIHGLHYWAAQAFIVVMGLHLARVFIWAAYKKPRELTWIFGVVLLLLGAAFIFTGAILPWDTLGYWAGEVGTSMAGTVPLIGTFLKSFMRGGSTMDQMTLSRAFLVHVAILPALTLLFIGAHLVAFRQFGSVGPWNPRKRKKIGWFWPDQTFKDLLVMAVILCVLIWLSGFVRAPITGPADPLDNSYAPKPEWNFLFLYEALKAFKGPWERVGTVAIPLLLVLLLFAVPFIDRNEKRNPFHRPVAMFLGLVFVTVILALTIIGHYSKPGSSVAASGPHTSLRSKSVLARAPALPPVKEHATTHPPSAPASRRALAKLPLPSHGHTSFSKAGALAAHPRDPMAHLISSSPQDPARILQPPAPGNVNSDPPLNSDPPPDPVQAVVPGHQHTQDDPPATNAPASAVTSAAMAGRRLFSSARCITCHTIDGMHGGKVGPNLSREAQLGRSRRWLIAQIVEPTKHDPTTVMPAHPTLKGRQLNDLAAFLLHPEVGESGAASASPGLQTPILSGPGYAQWQARLSPDERKNPVPASATNLEAGKRIYRAECMACHGPSGQGNGPASAALLVRVADLSAPTMWAYTDGALFYRITHGLHSMPAFGSLLTSTQRWEVVNYIRTLSPKPPGLQRQQHPKAPSVAPKATATVPAAPVAPHPKAPVPKPPVRSMAKAPTPLPSSTRTATNKVRKPSAPVNTLAAKAQAGRRLFVSARCIVCHKFMGKGGKVGPNLSHEKTLGRSRQWLITQIVDPKSHDPTTVMPSHKTLTEEQLNDLVDYLLHSTAAPSMAVTAPAVPAASQTSVAAAAAAGSHSTRIQEGARLFDSAHCIVCHTIEGMGGTLGPNLSHETHLGRTRQWLITQIMDPFKHNPTTIMYSHKALTERQLNDLADFLLNPAAGKAALQSALGRPTKQPTATTRPAASKVPPVSKMGPPGAAVKIIGSSSHGKILFALDCEKCHGPAGKGGVANPGSTAGQVPPLNPISRALFNKNPQVFAENIGRFIQHGARPPGPNPALRMPPFGDTRALTQPEIANLEAYILSLNGVDRAKIFAPGITPKRFLEGTVALFALAFLVMGGLWIGTRSGPPVQAESLPAPEDYQALKREVEALKHKLEDNPARKPEDNPGEGDSQS